MAGLVEGINQTADNTQRAADAGELVVGTSSRAATAAESTASTLGALDGENPLATADYTGPLVTLTTGGLDVPVGTSVLVAASPGRVKVAVSHAGADGSGNLWLGMGQDAQVGHGEWLEPGGRWEEFYAGDVRVFNAGAAAFRVTWMEWAA